MGVESEKTFTWYDNFYRSKTNHHPLVPEASTAIANLLVFFFSLARQELAQHNTEGDLLVAIRGNVSPSGR